MNERQAQDYACRRLYSVSCGRRNFFLRRTQKIVYPPMTSMPTAMSCNEERIGSFAVHITSGRSRKKYVWKLSGIPGIPMNFPEWNIFSRRCIQ